MTSNSRCNQAHLAFLDRPYILVPHSYQVVVGWVSTVMADGVTLNSLSLRAEPIHPMGFQSKSFPQRGFEEHGEGIASSDQG